VFVPLVDDRVEHRVEIVVTAQESAASAVVQSDT
jgi:hypothetical protein